MLFRINQMSDACKFNHVEVGMIGFNLDQSCKDHDRFHFLVNGQPCGSR